MRVPESAQRKTMHVQAFDPGLTACGMVDLDVTGDEPWKLARSKTWKPEGKTRGAVDDEGWIWRARDLRNDVFLFLTDGMDTGERRMAIETSKGVGLATGTRAHASVLSVYGGIFAVALSTNMPVTCAHVNEVRDALGGGRTKIGIRRALLMRGYDVRGLDTHQVDALAVAVYAGLLWKASSLERIGGA